MLRLTLHTALIDLDPDTESKQIPVMQPQHLVSHKHPCQASIHKHQKSRKQLLSWKINNLAADMAQLKSMIQEWKPHSPQAHVLQQSPPYIPFICNPPFSLSEECEDVMSIAVSSPSWSCSRIWTIMFNSGISNIWKQVLVSLQSLPSTQVNIL